MTTTTERPALPRLPLEQGLDSRKRFYCPHGSGEVPMWLARKTGSRTLFISFHGAINRAKRATPVFMPVMPMAGEQPNQLMIADPGMEGAGEFTLAWYAGYEGFNAQDALLDIIRRTIAHLGIEHVVFMGGSGGGFASLFYSWHFPGSTCIAVSPQTDIRNYYQSHLKRYLAGCWPALSGANALNEVICPDVVSLYRKSVPNTVVLLHSSGDLFHLTNHMAPLVSAITGHPKARLILQCGYWGGARPFAVGARPRGDPLAEHGRQPSRRIRPRAVDRLAPGWRRHRRRATSAAGSGRPIWARQGLRRRRSSPGEGADHIHAG